MLIEGEHAWGDPTTVTFESHTKLWRDKLQVTATDSIQIGLDAGRFSARGDVISTLGLFRIWADNLDVDDAAGIAKYSGSVRGRSPEMDQDAGELALLKHEN